VKREVILWLPLAIAVALMGMFYVSLSNPGEKVITSKLVGHPLPEFIAPAAFAGRGGASSSDLADGKPRLLNVFASWCVPCVQEVGVLRLMQAQGAEITGIAIHDTPDAVAAFLARNGDPYAGIGLDSEGRTQVAFGSTGVPETFVIGADGRILYQHIGPVTEEDMPMLLAKLELNP
jgi:cytochrome c biogenesis protein CcmG, thiol:disulfide interchange protein DsbE